VSEIKKDAINDVAPAVAHTLEGVASSVKTAGDNISDILDSLIINLTDSECGILVTILKALNTLILGLEGEIESIIKELSAGESYLMCMVGRNIILTA
jgi:hypothetical protein